MAMFRSRIKALATFYQNAFSKHNGQRFCHFNAMQNFISWFTCV